MGDSVGRLYQVEEAERVGDRDDWFFSWRFVGFLKGLFFYRRRCIFDYRGSSLER